MFFLPVCVAFLLVAMSTRSDSDELPLWAVRIASTTSPVRTARDQEADRIAAELGLMNGGRIEPFNDLYKFTLPLGEGGGNHWQHNRVRIVRDTAHQLEEHPSVEWARQQVVLKRTKRTSLSMREAVSVVNFNDPKYANQWHLHNTQERGHDVNATGIWRHNITGRGVVVAVVDDGVEHRNSDLTANYEPLGSYDFNSHDEDPTPDLSKQVDNTHGTRCAGLIAATANNSVCGVGVAYGGRVSGIRMLDGSVTDILEAQSFIYKAHVNHIYSCSWGPEDNGKTVEGPGPLAKDALRLGTKHGRYGYGNIYIFASGNGGTLDDNCNYDGYANSIYTLTIGAVDELNRMPYYAELCAAMLGVTYSNGQRRSIVTTDGTNHGGCTMGFSGTSAAAPIAAGMVALMLEVRPCLTWRDIQSIVVYSAVKVDTAGAEWVGNAAGFHHSDQHGFGLMDAYRLTLTAAVWELLPVMAVTRVEGGGAVRMPAAGRSLIQKVNVDRFDIPDNLVTLEYVAVTMKVSHVCRGSLEITLTSPAGTPSTLITPRRYDTSKDGFDWTFTSARFWGEGPHGTWILNITDHAKMCVKEARHGGVVHQWTLTFYGSSITPKEVTRRQRLVEGAVSSGSVESAFLCPPVNHTHHDITLPDTSHSSWSLLEMVSVTVTIVIVSVVILHFILDWFCHRRNVCTRPRPSTTSVFFTNRQSQDSEESCSLLIQEGGVANSEEGVVMLGDDLVGVNGNFNNNSVGECTSDAVRVCSSEDVRVCNCDTVKECDGDAVEVCHSEGVKVCSCDTVEVCGGDGKAQDVSGGVLVDNMTFDLDVTIPFDNDYPEHSINQSESAKLNNDDCHGDDDDMDETSQLLPCTSSDRTAS